MTVDRHANRRARKQAKQVQRKIHDRQRARERIEQADHERAERERTLDIRAAQEYREYLTALGKVTNNV